MRALRYTGNAFILIGATLLFFVFYELVGTSAVTNRHQDALAYEFERLVQDPRLGPAIDEEQRPRPRKRGGPPPIARIRIPSVGVDDIVVDGTSLATLAYGPGHYTATAPIGGVGSTGIAGHRTGWGSPFINLDRLGQGDSVILETTTAIHTYRVTRSIVVDPGDVWVLDGDPESTAERKLTLTTCTPKFTSRDRLIVWADHVGTEKR